MAEPHRQVPWDSQMEDGPKGEGLMALASRIARTDRQMQATS